MAINNHFGPPAHYPENPLVNSRRFVPSTNARDQTRAIQGLGRRCHPPPRMVRMEPALERQARSADAVAGA